MTTFNTFWKIVYQNKWGIIGYLVMSIALVMIMAFFITDAPDTFETVSLPVGIVNRDSNDPVSAGLLSFLEETYELVELEDDLTTMQDAVFFFEVAFVVVIPQGFGADFFETGNANFESLSRPDSAAATFVNVSIDNYFAVLGAFLSGGAFELQDAIYATQETLAINIDVEMARFERNEQTINPGYFNFMPFALVSVAIMLLAPVLMVFKRKELVSRMAISGTSSKERNMWILIAGALGMVALWALFMFIGRQFVMDSPNGLLMGANMFVFTMVAASIAFLCGQFIKKTAVLAGAAQVIALVLSFASGAFMPQEIMSDALLTFGRLLPSYWYIRTIDVLNQPGGTFEMSSFLQGIGIQVAFAVAILAVALVAGKEKAKSQ